MKRRDVGVVSSAPAAGRAITPQGEVPEWLNGAVSKTVVGASPPRVRIPLSPPLPSMYFSGLHGCVMPGATRAPTTCTPEFLFYAIAFPAALFGCDPPVAIGV